MSSEDRKLIFCSILHVISCLQPRLDVLLRSSLFHSSFLHYKCSASEKHITALSMEPGDVLLVDNYRALHGRDVFQGDRFHAVTWFTWDQNEEWRGHERRIVEKNAFNQAIK